MAETTSNSIQPGTGRAGSAPFFTLLQVLLLAAVYVGTAKLGLLLASIHGNVSPVWPATGLAGGALLIFGLRLWPGIALGAFLANALTPISKLAAAGIGAGNTLEAVAVALIVLWFDRNSKRFGSLSQPFSFVLAAAAAPVLSATAGVASLVLSGALPWKNVVPVWETWWVGDALGALMLLPALLSLKEARRWNMPDYFKLLVLLLMTGLVGGLVFFLPNGDGFLFGIFPLLLLSVAWLGAPGVKWAAVAIAAIAVSAAVAGSGPFSGGTLNEELLRLQLFMTSVAAAALFLPVIRHSGNLKLPGLVLMFGWLLSGGLFYYLQNERLQTDQKQMAHLTADAENQITQRMEIYTDALRAGVALFAESKTVTRAEWTAFASSLRLHKRYPGINGIGVIYRVPAAGASNFLAGVRADGMPDFAIHDVPDAVRPVDGLGGHEFFVVTYLEPLTNTVTKVNNTLALGLDVASETNRYAAAMRSATTGRPWITQRITLVQDQQQRAGFMLYVPFYNNGGQPRRLTHRRSELGGWVYAPFITTNFISGAFIETNHVLQLGFYNGKSTRPEDLLYTTPGLSGTKPPEQQSEIVLGGQVFTLGWHRGPDFPTASMSGPLSAAVCSALGSLLLAGLVMVLQTINRRAMAVVAERTGALSLADAALRESEDRYRMMVESVKDYAIFMLDPEGRVTSWNAGAERNKGYKAQEIIGRHFSVFYPLEELTAGLPESALAEARAKGRFEDEGWRVRNDGSRFFASVNITAICDELGKHKGYVKVTRDITEHRLAQVALKESQALYHSLVTHLPVGIFQKDQHGRYILVNDEFCRMRGQPAALFLGKTVQEVAASALPNGGSVPLITEYAAVGDEHFQEIMRTGKPIEIEEEFVGEGGVKTYLHAMKFPTLNADGKVVGVQAVVFDITERKRVEKAAAQSYALLRATLESTADGILTVGAERQILSVNENFVKMWRIPADVLATHNDGLLLQYALNQLHAPEAFLAKVNHLYEHPLEESFDVLAFKDDRIFERFSRPMLVEGQAVGRVWSFRDITARRQAEEHVAESLREKEALLREIHHRVKNNMQVITSILQLQTNYIRDPAAREVFRECQGRIHTMALIHEKLYRSEGLAQIDFKDYLESLVGLLLRSHATKGTSLRQELQIEPVTLDVDTAIPLGLITNELISNCLKHAFTGRPKGVVRVILRKHNGDGFQLVVLDDGLGLPSGFDLEKTHSLGLRLVKILSAQINGRLEFSRGPGAEFTITIDAPRV